MVSGQYPGVLEHPGPPHSLTSLTYHRSTITLSLSAIHQPIMGHLWKCVTEYTTYSTVQPGQHGVYGICASGLSTGEGSMSVPTRQNPCT